MTSHVSRALIWGWAVALVALSTGFFVYDPGDATVFVPPALMAVVLGSLIVTRVRDNPVGVEQDSKPTTGELDNECRAKEQAGNRRSR